MRKLVTTLFTFACLLSSLHAQNVITQDAIGQSPLTFVRENLAGGGVYIFNVKFANSSSSIKMGNIGTFDANGCDLLPFDKGIIMSSGHVSVAEGPNDKGSASVALTTYYSDPEMTAVATSTIHSCATLDFDFVSLSTAVSFNYVFASEEYPEFVCSNVNDAFAFFMTGMDPESGDEVTRNIAMIPGSDTIYGGKYPNGIVVSVNTVNPGNPVGSADGCMFEFSEYYIDNSTDDYSTPLNGTQFDGLTNKLAATSNIVPCQVYHMHISICNVGDNIYDSGVFIEGNSFQAPNASIGLSIPGVQTIMGSCPKGIKLTLNNTGFDKGTVQFDAGNGLQLGVDFDIVDAQGNVINDEGFTIDKSDRTFYLRARQGLDLTEDRTFDLYLTTQLCPEFPQLNLQDTMHFRITKGDDVKLRDTVLNCSEACFMVTAPLVYGSEPITYRWEPTTGIDNPYQRTSTAMITSNSEYKLIATGGTGCNSDTANVKIVINGSEWVGIDDIENTDVKVYASPAGDIIHVQGQQLQSIEVYSVEGRKVMTQSLNGRNNAAELNVQALEAGVYGVRVNTSNGTVGTKVILNK